MRFYLSLCLLFFACIAGAVHDNELGEVYRETLIVPPELRGQDVDADDKVELSALNKTAADAEFLSLFDME